MDLIKGGLNPFSYYLNNKKNNKVWKEEVNNFKYYLTKISPDFTILWCISDFISTLELLYMYHNVQTAPLHYIITKKKNVRSFRVNLKDFYIEYTLYEDAMRINCRIVRSWNSDATSEIDFINGECVMNTRSDEILMFTIVDLTMKNVHNIFTETYKRAPVIPSNLYKS